jgi:hypothetical protein
MLEGGGKSPIMSPLELQELGFKLVAYPLSLLGVSIRAMEDALKALKTGRLPPPSSVSDPFVKLLLNARLSCFSLQWFLMGSSRCLQVTLSMNERLSESWLQIASPVEGT